MIGLKRHTVRVVDHHPDWADMAAKACFQVRDAGGELIEDVQHIGSTAVPALPAKPILDLAVAVATLDVIPELIGKLTEIGYIYRGDGADDGGHLLVWESEPNIRTIHLHVVALDNAQWHHQGTLKFLTSFHREMCNLITGPPHYAGNRHVIMYG